MRATPCSAQLIKVVCLYANDQRKTELRYCEEVGFRSGVASDLADAGCLAFVFRGYDRLYGGSS